MNIITTEQLRERLAAGETINLVDVREHHERAEFHIGGTHLPLGKVQTFQLDDIEHLKDDEVVIYCRSGQRSMMAAQMLHAAGFQKVYNLHGGMVAWQKG